MKSSKIYIIQIILFIILCLIIESGARIFITRREFNGLAITEMIKKLNFYFYQSRYKNSEGILDKQKCITRQIHQELKLNEGKKLLKSLQRKYEDGFSNFIKTSKTKYKPQILLVYLPVIEDNNIYQNRFADYFKNLSNRNNIRFVDLTNDLVESGRIEDWSLLPNNAHYSRYGNKIIARKIIPIAEDLLNNTKLNKKNIPYKNIKAGLSRNKNLLWNVEPSMVYRVKTNSNGFRNNENISNNFLIGVYGASYTFGPYLANHDTFPSNLEYEIRKSNNGRYKNSQVLNAGLAGTNIFHQTQLLKQTNSISLDLIIMQVSDRDIYAVSSSYMQVVGPVKINNSSLLSASSIENIIYEGCGIESNKK